MYYKQVLGVSTHGRKYQAKKKSEKNGIGIENFGTGIEIDKFEVELELELSKWN